MDNKKRRGIPLGGATSSFLGVGTGTFSSGTGLFLSSGTLKTIIGLAERPTQRATHRYNS